MECLYGSTIGKLPAGDMFHASTSTGTGFIGGGDPLSIAHSAMTENVVLIGFSKTMLPSC